MKHPSPYAVLCRGDSLVPYGPVASCGIVYLSREGQHGYLWQISRLDRQWYCPNCGLTIRSMIDEDMMRNLNHYF